MRLQSILAFAATSLVLVASSAKADCVYTAQNKVGDLISVTATLTTGDPNENGEGEPVNITSSGGELNATFGDYVVPHPFLFYAKVANETIRGTNIGGDGDEACQLVVAVNPAQPFTPQQKQQAGNLAGKLGVGGAIVAIGGGILCTVTTGGICGAIIIGGAGIGGFGAVASNISSDPSDPNYKVIAQPVIAVIQPISSDPSIAPSTAAAFNALYANQAALIGIGNAAYITGNRAQGAHDAGDSTWEARQVQAAQLYANQIGVLLNKEITLLGNLKTALSTQGFSVNVTQNDTLNFEYQMAYSGLPANLKNALVQYGLNQDQVNLVQNLFMVNDVTVANGVVPDVLISPDLITALQTAAQAFNPIIKVTLDIKSEGSNNVINPNSNGVISAAILGTDKFDVTTVDTSTLRFGPNAAALATKAVITDINGDGIPDLLMHFKTQDAGIKCTDTAIVLTAKTRDGTMISGSDSIQTVSCN